MAFFAKVWMLMNILIWSLSLLGGWWLLREIWRQARMSRNDAAARRAEPSVPRPEGSPGPGGAP